MRTTRLHLVILVVLAALGATAFWAAANRERPLPHSWTGQVPSVSFAPYRWGQSPLTKTYPTPRQIEEDLALVGTVAKGVRTYTSREGMEVVPRLAGKYGLTVTHSAWLGTTLATNAKEIAALIDAANTYPDTIKRVIVGNEVLLRRDLKPNQLISYIKQVKENVRQPVSYADVWAFWLKYPEVAEHVDYITIHILPYWEDEPVDVADVERHFLTIYREIQDRFPGKPILIGEAGWPTQGRNRGPAAATMANGAEFVRHLAEMSQRHGFDYNVVEAFDQPWKSALEGTVGANWGIFDMDRQVKFPLSGPLPADRDWPLGAVLSVILAVGLVTAFAGRLTGAPLVAAALFVALTQALAVMVVQEGLYAFATSYTWWAIAWAAVKVTVITAMAGVLVQTAAALYTGGGRGPSALAERLALVTALAAVIWTGFIAFDGRYKDIPVNDFLVPVFGLLLFALGRFVLLLRGGAAAQAALAEAFAFDTLFGPEEAATETDDDEGPPPRRGRLLARLLPLAAVAAIISEGVAIIGEDFTKTHVGFEEQAPLVLAAMVSNVEILVWAAMLLLMSVPYTLNLRRAAQRQAIALRRSPEAN